MLNVVHPAVAAEGDLLTYGCASPAAPVMKQHIRSAHILQLTARRILLFLHKLSLVSISML